MRSTFTAEREARNSANPLITNAVTRWVVLRSPAPRTAPAINPPIPAACVREFGSPSVMSEANPVPTTRKNT